MPQVTTPEPRQVPLTVLDADKEVFEMRRLLARNSRSRLTLGAALPIAASRYTAYHPADASGLWG